MSCRLNNLSVLAYANGFTLWHYTTADSPAALTAAGYFDPAQDMLRQGDMILAHVNTAADRPGAEILLVDGSALGAVSVALMTHVPGVLP